MQKSIHLLLITSILMILNGCVAAIALGGFAGKELLEQSKSHEELTPNIETQPATTTVNTQDKVIRYAAAEQHAVVETPPQKSADAKKEVPQTKPIAQKKIPSIQAIPANQLELLNKLPWSVKSSPSIQNADSLKDAAFVFASNGLFSGFGGCNYFSGKFKANNEGDFLITSLKSSNEACSNNNDDETKLINTLIMADRFQIQDTTLTLLSEQLPLLTLDNSKNINITQLIQKSSNLKRAKQHKIRKQKASRLKQKK